MAIAPTAGIGFKPQHADAVLACRVPGLWLEVHPENYLVDGGPRLALLDALAERYPVALHGVSLSLAGPAPPDGAHLARLRTLVERVQPWLVSEHLAWSRWEAEYIPDLLPFPRDSLALTTTASHIAQTQDVLGRAIAIENPSHYVAIEGHEWAEPDFLKELVRRTGCQLLLDLNNVQVSAQNLGFAASQYLDAFPLAHVAEMHLAGHTTDEASETPLLIDSHDCPVATAVWGLYARILERMGPRPTLIERDGNVPDFAELLAERDHADGMLRAARTAT